MGNEKFYIIHFDDSRLYDAEINGLTNRIIKIGPWMEMDTNVFLVKSELTAQEIYSGLSRRDFENVRIFVCEIKPDDRNVWGLVEKNIWRFLNITPLNNEENNNQNGKVQ